MTTLTHDDVTALRRARSVTFVGFDEHHRGVCRAFCEKWNNEGFTDYEKRIFPHDFAGDGTTRARYIPITTFFSTATLGLDWGENHLRGQKLIGISHIHSARFDMAWQTIARTIKLGREVHVRFEADAHTNKSLGERGLHGDVAVLDVYNHNDRDQRVHEARFMLEVSVCPDNSARMVRALGSDLYITRNLKPEIYLKDLVRA